MPSASRRRVGGSSPPWLIGLVLVLASVLYAGWEIVSGGCAAPGAALVVALLVMPTVYLALMYLTLTSQE